MNFVSWAGPGSWVWASFPFLHLFFFLYSSFDADAWGANIDVDPKTPSSYRSYPFIWIPVNGCFRWLANWNLIRANDAAKVNFLLYNYVVSVNWLGTVAFWRTKTMWKHSGANIHIRTLARAHTHNRSQGLGLRQMEFLQKSISWSMENGRNIISLME